MAYIRDEHCSVCDRVTQHINNKCVECRTREYEEMERSWNAKSARWRMNDLRKRIEKLEQGPARY